MRFAKMQGLGNDYVYVNCFEEQVEDPGRLARFVSDRHFGIGSDGLILICPSEKADCRMRMFNGDGSEGIMCGNGIRCVGKYAYDHGIVNSLHMTVETLDGVKQLDMKARDGRVEMITVDMGTPGLAGPLGESIQVEGMNLQMTAVDVGSPHAVYYMDDIDGLELEKLGPAFEHHSRFPDRVNTEFVEVADRSHIRMRVWERGSGETWACGTGATASALVSMLLGLTDNHVEVQLRGGNLEISRNPETGHMFMTGPAVEVFSGEMDLARCGYAQ
ncbi:MAG: diaminopimelate epimerase [Eubacteriales bacterium]|nr:diaminopimelate epimerase [Eubacteriales bacterium]